MKSSYKFFKNEKNQAMLNVADEVYHANSHESLSKLIYKCYTGEFELDESSNKYLLKELKDKIKKFV